MTDHAVLFAVELRSAMAARGRSRTRLAVAMGGSRHTVTDWRRGHRLPRVETARRLATYLDWPELARIVERARVRACITCDREFVGNRHALYCSAECREVTRKRRMGRTTEHRAARAERQLAAHRRAVAAACAACEPTGRCVTPACALRPVSPLPLVWALISRTGADRLTIGRDASLSRSGATVTRSA